MTLEQLKSLDEAELSMALYITNVISPTHIEIPPTGLTWFRRGILEKKLLDAFPQVKFEAHPIYSSLLNKLGIQHEIKLEKLPEIDTNTPCISGSMQVTGSV